MKNREREANGLSGDEAHFAASRELGNVVRAREESRAVWTWPWLEGVWQDAKDTRRSVCWSGNGASSGCDEPTRNWTDWRSEKPCSQSQFGQLLELSGAVAECLRGNPSLSSSVSCRFVNGVSSGYTR